MKSGDAAQESRCVDLLERQIEGWKTAHPYSLVHGLDVGGGTPTALNPRDFAMVMKMAAELSREGRASDFEPSVELPYETVDDEKIAAIAAAGFTRASTGLQVVDKRAPS